MNRLFFLCQALNATPHLPLPPSTPPATDEADFEGKVSFTLAPKGKGSPSPKNSESVNGKVLPSKLQETESENSIQHVCRLERVQERGLRAALRDKLSSYKQLLEKVNLPTLNNRR